MEAAEYILCPWKGYLWPAKVLLKKGTPAQMKGRGAFHLEVQILSADERMTVKSTNVIALTEAGIRAIALSARLRLRVTDPPINARWKAAAPPGQLSTYRKALRLALESLQCRRPADQETTVVSTRVEIKGATLHSGPCPCPCSSRKHQKCKQYYLSKLRKQRYLQSLKVRHLGSEQALIDKESKVHKAIAPSSDEIETKASESANVGPKLPTAVGAVSQKVEEKKSRALITVSSTHPVFWKDKYAKAEFPGLFMRPDVMLTRPRTLRQKVKDTSHEITASEPHRIITLPESLKDSGGSASSAGLKGAGAGSASPDPKLPHSLLVVKQNGKHLEAGLKRGQKEYKAPKTSTGMRAVAIRKRAGNRRQGRAPNQAGEKPHLIERGKLVWFKLHGHPFWPAVVKRVSQTKNIARVLLIEANLRPERSGIPVHFCRLKHLDCEEKDKLVKRASKAHSHGMSWCSSLISHYQEEVTRRSFMGSFLDYFATNASYPARKALAETDLHLDFPKVNYADLEDSDEETAPGRKKPGKKLLPDRMKAARDRDNRKLVDFIVRKRGADQHLQDIIQAKKESTWLTSYLKPHKSLLCIETYLEDDDQSYEVAKHLQQLYEQTDKTTFHLLRGDKESFVMEVLLPEAMIYSIAEVDELSYQEAEKKYLQGPPVHYREKAEFDKHVLKERKRRTEFLKWSFSSTSFTT